MKHGKLKIIVTAHNYVVEVLEWKNMSRDLHLTDGIGRKAASSTHLKPSKDVQQDQTRISAMNART